MEQAHTQADAVRRRTDFYVAGYYTMTKLAMILGGALLIALVVAAVGWFREPKTYHYASRCDGTPIPLAVLNEPYVNSNKVVNFAADVATRVYRFDFQGYRQQLEANRPDFTRAGWDGFVAKLAENKNLETVVRQKLSVFSALKSAAVIAEEGVNLEGAPRGVYAWRVEFPMVITYQSIAESRTDVVLVRMLIVRRSPLEDDGRGIGVDQFILKPISV